MPSFSPGSVTAALPGSRAWPRSKWKTQLHSSAGSPQVHSAILAQITADLAVGGDLGDLLESLLDPIVVLANAQACAVRVLSPQDDRLEGRVISFHDSCSVARAAGMGNMPGAQFVFVIPGEIIKAICAICKAQFSKVLPYYGFDMSMVGGVHQLVGRAIRLGEPHWIHTGGNHEPPRSHSFSAPRGGACLP